MMMNLHQILVEMGGFEQNTGVIVIGATNTTDTLDQALLRPGCFSTGTWPYRSLACNATS